MAVNKKSSFGLMDGLGFSAAKEEPVKQNDGPELSHEESSKRRTDVCSHQGIKGERAKRSCIAFSDANYEFIKRESHWNGQTYSEFLEVIIDAYRQSYKRPDY